MKRKTTFDVSRSIRPIFTRGNVAISNDGRVLASCVGEDVLLTDLWHGGEELARIEGDGEIVTSLCITPSGSHLILCSRSLSMRIFSLSPTVSSKLDPKLLRTLKPHLAPVIVTTTDKSGSLFATGGADGIIKVWDIRGGFITHTFHGHAGVISALHFFEVPTSSTPAGTEDEPLKQGKKRKKKMKEDSDDEAEEKPGIASFRLASGGEDGKVRVWNLHKHRNSSASAASLDAHVSIVRGLCYCSAENALLSASRDRSIIVWDTRTWKVRLTIPVLEEVETAGFLVGGSVIYSGGETARLRLWDSNSGKELSKPQKEGTEIEGIQDSIYLKELGCLAVIHGDQMLTFYDTKTLELPKEDIFLEPLPQLRKLVGTHDQIVDVAYVGPPDRGLMALATNSEHVRIISTHIAHDRMNDDETGVFNSNHFGTEYGILKGHTDVVITMAADWSGSWILTGAKDNTARLWRFNPDTSLFDAYAVLTGHAESVSAVALPSYPPPEGSNSFRNPSTNPPEILVTGSGDKTIKRWLISKAKSDSTEKPTSRAAYTRKAHDKDINALAVHPSGRWFASASMDKAVKIWDAEEGSTVGVLRGHKRGVWTVAFSPPGVYIDGTSSGSGSGLKGFVATGAGDKTVRIWNLLDFTCTVTLEGHNGGVLKTVWLPPPADEQDRVTGPLVASAGADGLVKVWDVKTGECESTLDNHTDRVWALTSRPLRVSGAEGGGYSTLVSAGADSVLTFWTDTSSITTELALAAEVRQLETDQKLDNLVRAKHYKEAIGLALRLDRPGMLYELFKRAVDEGQEKRAGTADRLTKQEQDSVTGNQEVDKALLDLSDSQMFTLLLRIREWNANSRKELVAQRIFGCLVRGYGLERMAGLKPFSFANSAEEDTVEVMNGGRNAGRKFQGQETLVGVLEGLKTWTERHYLKAVELWDESFLVEFTLREMDALDLEEVGARENGMNGYVEVAVGSNGEEDGEESDVDMNDD